MDYDVQEYLGLSDIEYDYLIHRANKHVMSYPLVYPDIDDPDFDEEVK